MKDNDTSIGIDNEPHSHRVLGSLGQIWTMSWYWKIIRAIAIASRWSWSLAQRCHS